MERTSMTLGPMHSVPFSPDATALGIESSCMLVLTLYMFKCFVNCCFVPLNMC